MKKEKIAILTDSCCDVPKEYVEKYHMYVVPLKVVYKDREYLDGVDITPQEVYDGMKEEIPTSSLPDGGTFIKVLDQIKADGFEKVIAITLSSGLSGTNNMLNLIAADYEGLDIFILDTKNIAIGGGFHAIQTGKYLEQGLDFESIKHKLEEDIKRCKIFFVVETLEYLQKGGRIGLVASLFGNALHLKPVISCNEDGIYYTVAKVRGRKQSISRTMELALEFAKGHKKVNLGVVHGGAEEIAQECADHMKQQLSMCDTFVFGQISPVLGVHTGPGAIGIAIEILDED